MRQRGIVCLLAVSAWGQVDADAVVKVAKDYLEGWYSADCARLERALAPEVAKRRWMPGSSPVESLDRVTLVGYCRSGGGSSKPEAIKQSRYSLLDSVAGAGVAMGESGEYLETLIVARREGTMQALGVLWLLKRDADLNLTQPSADAAQRYYEAWTKKDAPQMEAAVAPEFRWYNVVRQAGKPEWLRTVDRAKLLEMVRNGKPSEGRGKVEIIWQRGPLAVARISNAAAGYIEYVQMARLPEGWRVFHVLWHRLDSSRNNPAL